MKILACILILALMGVFVDRCERRNLQADAYMEQARVEQIEMAMPSIPSLYGECRVVGTYTWSSSEALYVCASGELRLVVLKIRESE